MVIIAALLLVTGCSSNNSTNNQLNAKQTKIETHAPNAASTSTLTQASSISTEGAGKSSITIKQVPNEASNWLDWFQSNYGPAESPANQIVKPQQPANPQVSVNPQESVNPSQSAQQVLDLVNQERTKAGLNSLSMNSSLTKVAMAKAQDMYNNNYFDHQSPTYGSPFDMMTAFGVTYNSAGENIAKGQSSPTEVMNQWMNSPGHRANILNSSYTQIGIAYYNGEWVQEFIG
ncbi:CAP domain-containing protein [Paenibacillus chondroitinus]|uniref:CAP domain-containing protein n=1 Tax=Paenibacillus chondroitinus TaxID=59842 RepID=A0ABU6DHN4_9BACL|nr:MULTISPECIES: CAP domain-containing protein [Paenibacillus]MCY9662727.1 CAP domain-containing protein [Paenibacillus anseongense]MEB4797254.1 CAP domain-containing protein [Paenibacillus chondroitinus]